MAKNASCSVTTFINPHLFFITLNENLRNRQEIVEKKLEFHFQQRGRESVEHPVLNQLYVFIDANSVYKRVSLLAFSEKQYICWVVDYGLVCITNVLYKLPTACAPFERLSIKAGLNNIIALETQCNEYSGSVDFVPSLKFSDKNCRSVLKLINSAKKILFTEEIVNVDIHLGQLVITPNEGLAYNLSQRLVYEKFAMIDELKFKEAIPSALNFFGMEAFKKTTFDKSLDTCSGFGRGICRHQTKLEKHIGAEQKDPGEINESNYAYVRNWLEDVDEDSKFVDESESEESSKSHRSIKEENCSELFTSGQKNETQVFNLKPAGITLTRRRTSSTKSDNQSKSSSCSRESSRKIIKSASTSSKVTGSSEELDNRESYQTSKRTSVNSEVSESKIELDPVNDIPSFSHNNPSNHLKLGCSCKECQTWNINDFDVPDENFKKKEIPSKTIMQPPLLLKNEGDVSTLKIKSISEITKDLSIMQKSGLAKMLVHGVVVPYPQMSRSQIPFVKPVHRALQKLDFENCKPIQCCGWPALMRNMNLCMVNTQSTGKTMTYVPALYSFLLDKEDRYNYLPKLNGPIAIVLCPQAYIAESVYNSFVHFKNAVPMGVKVNIVLAIPPLQQHTYEQFKTPCDILIATPITLLTLLSKNIFNLKRTCHLVIEKIDVMLTKFNELLYKVLSVLQEMLKLRKCSNSVQFICTSERWTVSVELLLKKLKAVPLVCIGNHLESALYGRADIKIIDLQKNVKWDKLYEIIKDTYHLYKTIVVCNQEDIDDIRKLFQLYSVRMAIAEETMSSEDIYEIQKPWMCSTSGENIILICTDTILTSYLNITNASQLINYSLPQDWTAFTQRFSSLIDNYKSPLDTQNSGFNSKIYTFIDNVSSKEFPRIINYFQNVMGQLPDKLKNHCIELHNKEEQTKIRNEEKICYNLTSFGECNIHNCRRRHTFSNSLTDLTLPKTGLIKFKIGCIKEINHYYAILLEHTDSEGNVKSFTNRFELVANYLKECVCLEIAVDVSMHETYIFLENMTIYRCKIRGIIEKQIGTHAPLVVLIEGIDSGIVTKVSTNNLFKMPEYLKHIPPAVTEIFIANITPVHKDEKFPNKSKRALTKLLKNYNDENVYCTGNIVLQVEGIIWIDNLLIQNHLKHVHEIVNELNVVKYMKQIAMLEIDKECLKKLYKLCETCEIELPRYEDTNQRKMPSLTQAPVQWAYLSDECYDEVYFSSGIDPDNFFVKLKKFYFLHKQFEESIQKIICEPFYKQLKDDEIEIGKYYLAQDPEGENYGRVMVKDIKDDIADCFFVDYGDVAYIKKSDLKYLRDDLITKIPFQAIECSLYGIKSPLNTWIDGSVDFLYKYCFEPNTDIFRTLYALNRVQVDGSHGLNKKFRVVLIDNFNETNFIINKLFINSGFAVEVANEDLVIDVTLPTRELENVYSSDDEEFFDTLDYSNTIDEDDDDLDRWDVDGIEELLANFTFVKKNISENEPREVKDALPTIKALPSVDYSTPEVSWHQTLTKLVLNIKLIDIKDYTMKLVAGRLLTFETQCNERVYKLKMHLFDGVNKTFQHSSTALRISAIFTKNKESEWPRLVLGKEKMKHIKYDLEKIDLSEPEVKKFLDIGKFDECSENESDDGYIFEIGSDFDDSESDLEMSDDS